MVSVLHLLLCTPLLALTRNWSELEQLEQLESIDDQISQLKEAVEASDPSLERRGCSTLCFRGGKDQSNLVSKKVLEELMKGHAELGAGTIVRAPEAETTEEVKGHVGPPGTTFEGRGCGSEMPKDSDFKFDCRDFGTCAPKYIKKFLGREGACVEKEVTRAVSMRTTGYPKIGIKKIEDMFEVVNSQAPYNSNNRWKVVYEMSMKDYNILQANTYKLEKTFSECTNCKGIQHSDECECTWDTGMRSFIQAGPTVFNKQSTEVTVSRSGYVMPKGDRLDFGVPWKGGQAPEGTYKVKNPAALKGEVREKVFLEGEGKDYVFLNPGKGGNVANPLYNLQRGYVSIGIEAGKNGAGQDGCVEDVAVSFLSTKPATKDWMPFTTFKSTSGEIRGSVKEPGRNWEQKCLKIWRKGGGLMGPKCTDMKAVKDDLEILEVSDSVFGACKDMLLKAATKKDD